MLRWRCPPHFVVGLRPQPGKNIQNNPSAIPATSHLFKYLLLAFCCLAVPQLNAQVIINEIHYEPDDKTAAEEFIELHNAAEDAVDLSGWYFSNGVFFRFPDGTVLAGGGYLVVAEDPVVLARNLSVEDALGPWEGRLDNKGETLTLRDASGSRVDEVDYQAGFPWPLASQGKGSSMELLHPGSDNNLAGSWRASGLIERPFTERVYFVRGESTSWRYRLGTSEASNPPNRWREAGFALDESWLSGQASIGFGDNDDNTELANMRNSYTSIYMRHTFTIEDASGIPDALVLNQYFDDGAIVWINGTEVLRYNMEDGEQAHDDEALGGREARWIPVSVQNPQAYFRVGENLVAVHAFNTSLNSSDTSADLELYSPGTEDEEPGALLPPSPGRRNTVFSGNPGPQVRQVDHSPEQPAADEPLLVTTKITDPQGILEVNLKYQVVRPGNYIPAFLSHAHSILLSQPSRPHEPNPEFENPGNWTSLRMTDDGLGGDETAADGIFSALVPGQDHRTLLRYRITATDNPGTAVTVPYKD
ncbi:MAG: lamin tail domain-containing protein, partial [Planctomycetota bacterium]|nr:lamin tail domain-containing protein [Planctomycetota bacterium]